MWIVRIALHPALHLRRAGAGAADPRDRLAIVRTPTDILPDIDIPVCRVVWNYDGLSAEEMSTRIVFNVERSLTTTVNDIEHIESQSLNGVGIIKVFFQPCADVEMALAQVTAIVQTLLRQLPPGINAAARHQLQRVERADPAARRSRASRCPSSSSYDFGVQLHPHAAGDGAGRRDPLAVRRPAATGAGGPRSCMALAGEEPHAGATSSPPISAQNLILPAGTSKIGTREYDVDINGARERSTS